MLEIIKAYWNLKETEDFVTGAKAMCLLSNDTINDRMCDEILGDIARLRKIIWRKPRRAKKLNEDIRRFKK